MAEEKQFAVLGLGRFGRSIVRTLVDSGYMVLACDKKIEIVNEISKTSAYCVQINLIDEDSIKSLGLNNFDVVVIAIGTDMESSIMTTLLAKKHGAKFVISKALNSTHRAILEKVGADKVILPEMEMGISVARSMISDNFLESMTLSEMHSIVEIEPLAEWRGKTLEQLALRQKYHINLIAIKRKNILIANMSANEKILEGDSVYILGENYEIRRIAEKSDLKVKAHVNKKQHKKKLRKK